jgi:hypothetical protein
VQNPTVDVVFPSNKPVIDSLRDITVEAAKVIERFQGDFGEHFRLRLERS